MKQFCWDDFFLIGPKRFWVVGGRDISLSKYVLQVFCALCNFFASIKVDFVGLPSILKVLCYGLPNLFYLSCLKSASRETLP